ncbi:MAG: hypothetical protein ABFC77_01710 [Thermoguttaceae bacterium]
MNPSQTLQWLDYVAIGGYMATLAVLGLVMGRLVRDVGAYFKAGGTLPWQAAAVSNFTAMLSTFMFVAYAGIAYEYGLVAVTIFWCTVPPALFAAAIIGQRWRRARVMTPVEYLETRFNVPVHQFLSWCGMGFRVLDNMVRLYAMAVFMSAATPLPIEVSILVAGAVILICTVSGGLWSVVLIDVVQFVILILATVVMLPLVLQACGGLGSLMHALPEHFSFFQGPKGAPLFLLAYYTMVLIKYNGNWSFIQRFYSVRDEAAGRKMAITMAVLFFVTPFFFLLPAVAAKVIVPDLANPEQAYAVVAMRVLPHGITGLLLAAMLASTMSCVAAEFNVTASVFTQDVYRRLLRRSASSRELMWAARVATFVIGSLVIFGALFMGRFGGAFNANMILTGLAIPLSVPLVLGILLHRARPWGALAAVLVGVPTGIVLNLYSGVSWPVATLTVVVVSIGAMLISGLAPSRDAAYRQRVEAFFAKLATPIAKSEKPEIAPAFRRALTSIFVAAFLCTGLLFIVMSLPSIGRLSGSLALVAGGISLGLAFVIRRLGGCREQAAAATGVAPQRADSQETV